MADLVLTCERFFDGRRLVEGGATVLVEGDRIAAVHTNDATPERLPEGKRMHGSFLMPGLIDSHVHLIGHREGPPGGAPFALEEHFMRLLTCNGVTTVRDAGNAIETVRYCQHWSATHDGPRIIPTGPLLDAPPLMWPFSRIVHAADEAQREVQRLSAEGLGWVSLYHNVSLDVAQAAIAAARAAGLRVAADVHRVPARELLDAGVTSLEHAHNLLHTGPTNGSPDTVAHRMQRWSRIDPESEDIERLIGALLDHRTVVCPTLLVTHRWCSIEAMVQEPYLEYMVAVMPYARNFLRMRQPMGLVIGKRFLNQHLPVPTLSRREQVAVNTGLRTLKAVVRRLHEAGVPLVVGTDAPSPSVVPGFSMHQELALLVESGVPPTAALACATAEAAGLIGQPDDLGCIRPGALADLLVIDGNPAVDIGDTRKIQAVIKGGRKVDRKPMFDAVRAAIDSL